MFPSVTLALPDWIESFVADFHMEFRTKEDRMRFAVELSRRNSEAGGGPFGAAIFDLNTDTLLAPGVNMVVPAHCSVAHAEIVAIMIAQQIVKNFDLAADSRARYELVTSSAPCAQCFGAIPWSGVNSLVCGSRREDVEAIGFDEGPKPSDWVARLEERNITVYQDVCRDQAVAVLTAYKDKGALIYNSSRNG